MSVKFANNAHSTLASSINTSATSITVASGQGARFPSLTGSEYFYATLIDTSNNLEIVKVTARSTDVLTVTRAQESTTARAFASGDRIELRVTAQGIADATTIQNDQITNAMIATDAVNADSIAANAVGASEINVSGNGTAGQSLLSDGDGTFSFGLGGRLVQVVTASYNQDFVFSTTSSFTEVPNLSITITPTSASNKIILQGFMQGHVYDQYTYCRFLRDVSGVGESVPSGWYGHNDGSGHQLATFGNLYRNLGNADSHSPGPIPFTLVDSDHNTTSAISYKVKLRTSAGTYSTYFGRSHQDNTSYTARFPCWSVVAMEVSS